MFCACFGCKNVPSSFFSSIHYYIFNSWRDSVDIMKLFCRMNIKLAENHSVNKYLIYERVAGCWCLQHATVQHDRRVHVRRVIKRNMCMHGTRYAQHRVCIRSPIICYSGCRRVNNHASAHFMCTNRPQPTCPIRASDPFRIAYMHTTRVQ